MFFFKLFPLLLAVAVCVSPSLSTPSPVIADLVTAQSGPKCTQVLVPVTITANNAVGLVLILILLRHYFLREVTNADHRTPRKSRLLLRLYSIFSTWSHLSPLLSPYSTSWLISSTSRSQPHKAALTTLRELTVNQKYTFQRERTPYNFWPTLQPMTVSMWVHSDSSRPRIHPCS